MTSQGRQWRFAEEEVIQGRPAARKFLVERAGGLGGFAPQKLAAKLFRHECDSDEHGGPHAPVTTRWIVQCRMHSQEVETDVIAPSPL